jgi:hypothetical protein
MASSQNEALHEWRRNVAFKNRDEKSLLDKGGASLEVVTLQDKKGFFNQK